MCDCPTCITETFAEIRAELADAAAQQPTASRTSSSTGEKQANLTEIAPGKWEGPCPLCGQPGILHVEVGRNGDVIWTVTGKCHHTREDIYPQLKFQVPCAPEPGHQTNPKRTSSKTP